MSGRFSGKSAIITGGAKGIGRATVLRLMREGGRATVVEAEKPDSEWAQSLGQEAKNLGAEFLYIHADVTNEGNVKQAVAQAEAKFGSADILINNVGFSINATPLDEHSLEKWEHAFRVNVTSTFLMTRAVLPGMRKKGGAIVNMSSIAGTQISENAHLEYHAAKAAIVGFTHKLAFEEGKYGIRVNAVAPGTTLTERVAPRYTGLTPEVHARKMALIPLGRAAQPHEMASVILFLASDDASYVSGITLNANGGRYMT